MNIYNVDFCDCLSIYIRKNIVSLINLIQFLIFDSSNCFSIINLFIQDGDVIELAQVSDIRYGGTPKVNDAIIIRLKFFINIT